MAQSALTATHQTCQPDLVEMVELKWLMAGHGLWLDVPRLCREPAYARSTLEVALALPSDLIRRIAQRILTPLI